MGTDRDTTDDDLEELLEFDDSHPISAPITARKQQPPSNTLSTSSSITEPARPTPRYLDAINRRNSPEPFQAEEKQATRFSDKSTDEGDEETSPRTSLRNDSGGHDISQHSLGEPEEQNLNEETDNFHDKRSDDDAASEDNCSDNEELMFSKQEFRSERPDVRRNVEETDERDREQDVILLSGVGREIAPKRRLGRDLPDNRHNVEEMDDEDTEQDVRVLSGVGSGRRAAIGYGTPQETRGRASKRIRQDGNAGTGWDDCIVVDDFAKGGMDCSQGGEDGRSLQASPFSSPERPLIQEGAEVGQGCHSGMELAHTESPLERQTSPPVTVLGYKIPGPAGALQNCLNSTGHRTKGLTHIEKYCGPSRLSHMPTSAADTLDFREGPWLAAMDSLNDGDSTLGIQSSRSTIVTIKATKRHIPQLVAIINTAVPNGLGDLSVTLKVDIFTSGQGVEKELICTCQSPEDPTGTIGGTIHRKVLTELEDGHLITPGAVIIIRKVAVFSPTPFKHYLNITIKNVDQIFGKVTIAPRRRGKAINDMNISGITGKEQPISEPGSNDALQVQTAAKEGYQSETVAPDFGDSEKQGGPDFTDVLDNDERIQADCPNDKSPGSDTMARKSLPSPTLPEDAVGSRKVALTANVSDPKQPPREFHSDARASEDAIAKAAGWDLSEDVELLLADDFL